MGYEQFTDGSEASASRQHERGETIIVTADHPGLVFQQVPHEVNPLISLLSSFPVNMEAD